GNTTTLDISARGLRVSDFLVVPNNAPDDDDIVDDESYMWLGDGATAGIPDAGTLVGLSDVNIVSPTNGQALVWNSATSKWVNGDVASGGGTWGSITGVLSNQTDLQAALNGKANLTHTHDASNITSGVLNIARIPTGTTGSTVALGNHTHTFAQITNKPTTLSGYGITDAYTKGEVDNAFVPYTGANKAIDFNTQNLTIGGYTNKLSTYFERINLASDSTSTGNFKLLTNVAASEIGNASTQSADIIITLPITTTTHWQAEIDILRAGYRTTLNIGGYDASNTGRFVNVVY